MDCGCAVFAQYFFGFWFLGYCGFSLWRQLAPQQIAKFRTAFLVNFVPV